MTPGADERGASRLERLLERYVEQHLLDGGILEPEELCRDDPELLEPLRGCIREYERLSRWLAPPGRLTAGRLLLHYRIVEPIGAGGMGEVYLAEDLKLGRRVALKVLPAARAADPDRLERFRREARAVAALNHPNIVTLHAVEEADGIHFLILELVPGKTLDSAISPGGMTLEKILSIAEALTDALAAAHEQGIVHRDLKPANVMLTPSGRLKVLDFGLAKLNAKLKAEPGDEAPGEDLTRTRDGRILGTVPYMSPEQARGLPPDLRSDLFSLGVILYEMATGRRPFRGSHTTELLGSILRDKPEPIRALRGDLPRSLERLVGRCLEKDPGRRFQSALELRSDLRGLRAEIESGVAQAAHAEKIPSGLLPTRESRRLFVSSTSDDLAPYRAAACEVARDLGFEPVPEHPPADGAVAARGRLVESCEALLAIVGWRRGAVPGPELGGDGLRPYVQWEVWSAFRRAKPVLVAMAGDRWPEELSDDDPEARSWVRDFRGELERLAVVFDPEEIDAGSETPLPGFRARLAGLLARYRRGARGKGPTRLPSAGELRLSTWPPPELPAQPYPVLLPYAHPDLLGGREGELAELRQLLRQPVPILGLYAPSGAGKSSLLAGGLVPALRAEGLPVALDRHPSEPGLPRRLLGDLLTAAGGASPKEGRGGGELEVGDEDFRTFVDLLLGVDRLGAARHLAEESSLRGAPVLVVDQVEDLFRHPGRRRARAVFGALLAASVQRQPGLEGPLCRWLLAYRQEFHGEVCGWLADALREARGEGLAGVESLPHELSGPERFQGWPLPPLGTPAGGSTDRFEEACRAFLEAIEKPLAVLTDDGTPRYPWRFAGDGAARLARVFGAARLARPEAALAPELQVVLAHLLDETGEPTGDEAALIVVPDEPAELIDCALEEHLRRALDGAFPAGRDTEARLGRTRALLALRELADGHGRRHEGLPAVALAEAIGGEGKEVLERLATPQTRLVVLEGGPEGWRYALSHDRMAEVVVGAVEEEGRYGRLGVDAELLALRRFVVLNTELYQGGEIEQATRLPRGHVRLIEKHAGALLWGEDRRRWWAACQKRRRADRRRATTWRSIAAVILLLLAAGSWTLADRRAEIEALYQQIAAGEPEVALAALDRLGSLPNADLEELRSRLRLRESPMDLLERGMGGVREGRRGAVVLSAVETALPLVAEAPEDPVLIANLVWALDYAPGRDPRYASRARALRDQVLEPLRRLRPPPPPPNPEDPEWADLPGGVFQMGLAPAANAPGESPQWELQMEGAGREVEISPFRMLTHEVTNEEYRRLVPGHPGADALPATVETWYEAYTYAAWLGGRLPTEAEWEFAARAGCRFEYCTRHGEETTLAEVAWVRWNSGNADNGHPVMQLEPNQWGLFDLYGNAAEWVADWADEYPAAAERDPWGPPTGDRRIERGGATWYTNPERSARATARGARHPGKGSPTRQGFRVVHPGASHGG